MYAMKFNNTRKGFFLHTLCYIYGAKYFLYWEQILWTELLQQYQCFHSFNYKKKQLFIQYQYCLFKSINTPDNVDIKKYICLEKFDISDNWNFGSRLPNS